jgi:hypothetical protein
MSGYVASISVGLPTLVGSSLIALGGIMFWIRFKPKTMQNFQGDALTTALH